MASIVMFGGGSGCRSINMALCANGHRVTRVVPAWDSGGSSRALRQALGILAVGDIRQALMTMAHGEGRVGSVVKFFNARLSESAAPEELRAEFDYYASGAHPLLGTMEPGIRGAILNYLRNFRSRIGPDFDFRRGSIGNFVLAGAYFAHGNDINTAIFVFRKLCSIEGNVWPVTVDDRVQLHAQLRDGTQVAGQDRVTALPPAQAAVGIGRVELTRDDGAAAAIEPNPAVLEAVAEADVVVFGPGSFYSSVLPHLSVQGIADAIAGRPAAVARVLVGNVLECPETTGRTLAEMVQAFDAARGALTHVLANRLLVPFEPVVGGFRYLRTGVLDGRAGVISDDFEDPWNRGRHDARRVAAVVEGISGSRRSTLD